MGSSLLLRAHSQRSRRCGCRWCGCRIHIEFQRGVFHHKPSRDQPCQSKSQNLHYDVGRFNIPSPLGAHLPPFPPHLLHPSNPGLRLFLKHTWQPPASESWHCSSPRAQMASSLTSTRSSLKVRFFKMSFWPKVGGLDPHHLMFFFS